MYPGGPIVTKSKVRHPMLLLTVSGGKVGVRGGSRLSQEVRQLAWWIHTVTRGKVMGPRGTTLSLDVR